MTSVELRLCGLSHRKESIRERIPFAVVERDDVVIRSQLDPSKPLNEHLVWLWGMLRHERRFLKNLRQEGGKIICWGRVPKGGVRLLPNGAEMLHLLEVELVLDVR